MYSETFIEIPRSLALRCRPPRRTCVADVSRVASGLRPRSSKPYRAAQPDRVARRRARQRRRATGQDALRGPERGVRVDQVVEADAFRRHEQLRHGVAELAAQQLVAQTQAGWRLLARAQAGAGVHRREAHFGMDLEHALVEVRPLAQRRVPLADLRQDRPRLRADTAAVDAK